MEAELIDNHREEVSQLKKLVAQKEEDLHKTVQKYEQVLQVAWNRKTTFCLDFRKKIYIYIKNIYKYIPSPFGSHQCWQLPIGLWLSFGSLSYELKHLLH